MRTGLALCVLTLVSTGCAREVDSADPEFSDALAWLYRNQDAPAHEVAFVVRSIESDLYTTLDMTAKDTKDRTLEPQDLTEDDLEGLVHPNRDLGLAVAVATTRLSNYAPELHSQVILMADQRPVEPYSPDLYDRVFVEGADCWQGKGCNYVRTENDITKKNVLMECNYQMKKNWRWVDLNLPAPSELDPGEEPVNDGDPRWALIGKSWVEESAEGEGGKSVIQQSYAVEFTVPRDGGGFTWAESDLVPPTEDAPDSSGGGSIRMQSLWSETTFTGINVGEDLVKSTIRGGIDKIMKTTDDYIEEELADQ